MKIKIEFEIFIEDVPHTPLELSEYLMFAYGQTGTLRYENPFNLAARKGKRIIDEPIWDTFKHSICED